MITKAQINEAAQELGFFVDGSFNCGIDEIASRMAEIVKAGARCLWLEQINKLDIDAVVLIQWREEDAPKLAQVVSISRDENDKVTRVKVQDYNENTLKFNGCISRQLTPETAIKEIIDLGGDN